MAPKSRHAMTTAMLAAAAMGGGMPSMALGTLPALPPEEIARQRAAAEATRKRKAAKRQRQHERGAK